MLTSELNGIAGAVAPARAVLGREHPLLEASARHANPTRTPALRTVAFVGKGGSGKSSTGINLGVLARRAGFRVGMIDADPQQSAALWRRVRQRADIPVCRCDPDALHDGIEAARRAGIEVLLIDMPPDLRLVPIAARCSDLVIIPMRPALFDLQVTRGLIPLLSSVGVRYGVVINAAPPVRDQGDSPMVRQTRDALKGIGQSLWRSQITSRVAIPYATVRGAAVVETEPEGPAAREYQALWNSVSKILKLEGAAR